MTDVSVWRSQRPLEIAEHSRILILVFRGIVDPLFEHVLVVFVVQFYVPDFHWNFDFFRCLSLGEDAFRGCFQGAVTPWVCRFVKHEHMCEIFEVLGYIPYTQCILFYALQTPWGRGPWGAITTRSRLTRSMCTQNKKSTV